MKLNNVLELLARLLMEVLIAERMEALKTGEDKKSYVMGKVTASFQEPRSPAMIDLVDITEIIETIGKIVDLVVKLLSLLGIFKHALGPGEKKDSPEDE